MEELSNTTKKEVEVEPLAEPQKGKKYPIEVGGFKGTVSEWKEFGTKISTIEHAIRQGQIDPDEIIEKYKLVRIVSF